MIATLDALLTRITRWRTALQVGLLAALAFLPTITAAPGKMPSDTKLYLYFDPARLTADALSTWDTRQFAGWVPHQTLSYLWPSGPWYSFFSWIGAPDWVAHRLWLGTLFLAAGLGVRWAAKHLGIGPVGSLVAALFYQLSPYVLPYVSRTSAMLLPWAAVGWLVGLTIRAATRSRWRDVGIFGLVMLTVAAPNATAILMIAPAPVLWLLHAGWSRIVSWRRVAITAAKIGGISALMSVWWIAMLAVQGRFGADVLGYSESLEAVSLTSSSAEVLRGMGYWLFYVRDPVGFATTASFDYMSSGRLIAISFAVLGIGLLGIVSTKWTSRRYAALLVFVGVVLAVGVHPIDDPSPLMSGFADNSRSSIALALRSSTRALPLSTFGIALGAGALVTALGRTRLRGRSVVPWIAGGLAIANLPVIFNGGFVDPNLIRDQDPPRAWTEAASALDAAPDGYRVFQLPGQEFGAFRWGYTVDPPLPGLTEEPLVTRDLLPLGSAGAMDLVYALDNRFQEGIAEPAEVAPIARLLGVDTIWLPNDAAFERFRTPRPELTEQFFGAAEGEGGLGPPTAYGTPAVNVPELEMVDEESISQAVIGTPLPPVELVPVQSAVPIMRTKTDVVMVAGSGDGVVDAAAAGLLSGDELIRYAADNDPAAGGAAPDAVATAPHVIVTDSNRDRASQWRSAQDVAGFTEDGSGTGVLRFDSADQRTPVFVDPTSDDMTIAEQRGPLRAAASSYGAPSAYLPEHRAAMAVDGDPTTSWVVADRFDAEGEYLRIDSDDPLDVLTLTQPQDGRNRWISRVDVTDSSGTYPVDLTESSRQSGGQVLTLRRPSERVTLTIRATATGELRPGEGLDAVGFAEVDAGSGPTEEVVRVPSNVLPRVGVDQRLDIVLSRLRTRPTNRWRSDPETHLTRSFTLGDARSFVPDVTTRLDLRSSDAAIAALIGWTGATAQRRLTGVPAAGGWAATDGDRSTSWITPFGQAIGSTLTVPLAALTTIGSLQIHQPDSAQLARITEVEVASESGSQIVPVDPPDSNGMSTLSFPALTGTSLRVTITGTDDRITIDRRYSEPVRLPVGISEIGGTGIVARALPDRFDSECLTDALTIDGTPVGLQVGATIADMFAGRPTTTTTCQSTSLDLTAGEHLVRSVSGASTALDVDRIVLSSADDAAAPSAADPAAAPTATAAEPTPAAAATVVSQTKTSRTVEVGACPTGCWFVFGEGYNDGWEASVDGSSLGKQTQVDGGFNGWYLPPSAEARTIHLEFAGQRTLVIGLLLTGLGLLACIALIVFDRRRTDVEPADQPTAIPLWGHPLGGSPYRWRSAATLGTAAAAVAGVLVISPLWGVICATITFVACFLLRRPRVTGYAAVAIATYLAVVMVRRVTSLHPFANAGWPGEFEDLHRLGMSVVVLLFASAVATLRPGRDEPARDEPRAPLPQPGTTDS